MTRKKPSRVYGKTGHPMMEAMPLALAFLIGTTGGIIFKVLPFHPAAGALFAAIVLVGYAIIAFFATTLRSDAETIGDNCYYLGFLFTLTSLAVTLYFVVSADASDRAALIPSIISGFGVALSSTIVGVFLRVFMLQLKVDVESRERRARMELDESARRFRLELGTSLERIKSFSTESIQQSAEREDRMRQAFDKILADMQSELLKSAEEFGPALRESIRLQTQASLAQVTTAVNEASANAAAGIREAMADMIRITTTLADENIEAAEAIRTGVSRMQSSSTALAEGSDATIVQLGMARASASRLSEAMMLQVNEDTTAITAAITRASLQIAAGTNSYTDATERMSELLKTGAQKIGEGVEFAAQSIKDAGSKVATQVEASGAGVTEEVRAAAIDGARKLQESYSASAEAIREAGNRAAGRI